MDQEKMGLSQSTVEKEGVPYVDETSLIKYGNMPCFA